MGLILCFLFFFAFDLFLDFITERTKKPTNNNDSDVKQQTKAKIQPEVRAQPSKPIELVEKEKIVSDLQAEITQLGEESVKYNNPSEYAKYSKMQRKMITLQRKLDEEKGLLKTLSDNWESSQGEKKPAEESSELIEKEQPVEEASSLSNVTGGLVSKNTIIVKAIRIILPAILIYSLPKSVFTIKMDASYLSPLSNYLGEQQGDLYVFSRRITWIVFSFRTIGRLKKLVKGVSLGKNTPTPVAETKTQGKQKVE